MTRSRLGRHRRRDSRSAAAAAGFASLLCVLVLGACGAQPPPVQITSDSRELATQQDGYYRVDWNVPGCSSHITMELVTKGQLDFAKAAGGVSVPAIDLGVGPSGSAVVWLAAASSSASSGVEATYVMLAPKECDAYRWSLTMTWDHSGGP